MFEDNIMVKIKKKFNKNEVIKITESYNSRDINFYNKTIDAMKKGIPIIYQGVIHDKKNKSFGCADLIVRSDYLNKLIDDNVITKEEEKINAPKLGNQNYHYRIIDIKFSKLHFNVDGITLRDSANIKPFKCQICIYNNGLGDMQGYTPTTGYILGNGWVINKTVKGKKIKTKNTSPFNKLGQIKFEENDKKYEDISNDAIKWVRAVVTSKDWTHDPLYGSEGNEK